MVISETACFVTKTEYMFALCIFDNIFIMTMQTSSLTKQSENSVNDRQKDRGLTVCRWSDISSSPSIQ